MSNIDSSDGVKATGQCCFSHRIMEECLTKRPAPPSDVLCLPLINSWRDRVWRIMDDVITERVRAEFLASPPERIDSQNLAWLDEIIVDAEDRFVDSKAIMTCRLSKEFRAFRAAHATRTGKVESFYNNGLRKLRATDIETQARDLFRSTSATITTEELLKRAITKIDARHPGCAREGTIYFSMNENELKSREGCSGHYLTYGSEYLYCLGIRMIGDHETQKLLKSIGRSTLFICDIPTPMIHASIIEEVSGLVLSLLFSNLLDGSETDATRVAAVISLDVDLPPEHIVGHVHPTKVYDPIRSEYHIESD